MYHRLIRLREYNGKLFIYIKLCEREVAEIESVTIIYTCIKPLD